MKTSKKLIFTGIIIISLGISFTTVLKESVGDLGTLMLSVGGLIFIAGMSRKRSEGIIENEKKDKKEKDEN